jgi:transposase
VTVPVERDPEPVGEFRSFTAELCRLADWLTQCRIKTVAMESTGGLLDSALRNLEARGFEVVLVNARDVHNVPGRKSEVQDCEWLRELHSVGLLRASFRPSAAIDATANDRRRCCWRSQRFLVRQPAQHDLSIAGLSLLRRRLYKQSRRISERSSGGSRVISGAKNCS